MHDLQQRHGTRWANPENRATAHNRAIADNSPRHTVGIAGTDTPRWESFEGICYICSAEGLSAK